jgi:hypothetical protein
MPYGKSRISIRRYGLTQQSQDGVQLAHEHFAPSLLVIFASLERGLNVVVRLEQENQVRHAGEPRIRFFTASQVVN